MCNEVIRIKADGTRCRIPDEVLQTYGVKTCYERYPDGTYRAYSFSVLYAPKPPDYVYTPEERTTFEALTARVDAAIEEIKRRADSGEFDGKTPVKGVDYYTKEEKAELITAVSSGAESEFRKVTEAETAKFEATAAEKLEAYNSNNAAKVAEYNQNAETKTAEFDANAAALQTEVDRLRGECDTLAAENRKQENRISALMKLNKGQTYDILPEEGETVSRTAPSGAKYVSVDKVGGKSVVWNQLWNYGETVKEDGVTFTYENHFYDVVKNTTANNGIYVLYNVKERNKYYLSFEASSSDNIVLNLSLGQWLSAKLTEKNERYSTVITSDAIIPTPRVAIYLYSPSGGNCSYRVGNIKVVDLTAMFGAGNEPTAEQFERMFPAESYPYNPGEIISSTTANVELEGKNLWNDSDPAFTQVLTRAGFTFDGSVWKSELIDYIATPIKIEKGTTFSYDIKAPAGANARFKFAMNSGNLIYRPHESDGSWKHHSVYLPDDVHTIYIDYTQRASCEIKNIQLERSTTETAYSPHTKKSLSTCFPELHSAGTAHDEIDMDSGAIRRNVGTVDLGSLSWSYSDKYEWLESNSMIGQIVAPAGSSLAANAICNRFEIVKQNDNYIKPGVSVWTSGKISVKSDEIKSAEDLSGVTLYFEKVTPTTEQVTIPEALTEWLPVEAGGTVTFRNSDDTKQLPVPNAVSWVRKLNEVN